MVLARPRQGLARARGGAQPKVPEAPASCANPVDKVLEVGHKLGVNSTPTLFFANGERMAGGLAAEDLKEMLDRAAAARQ